MAFMYTLKLVRKRWQNLLSYRAWGVNVIPMSGVALPDSAFAAGIIVEASQQTNTPTGT